MRREVNMLTEIEIREKRQKLRGESVCRIIKMNVKVTGDDKFMGCGCSRGQKRTEVIEEDRVWFSLWFRRPQKIVCCRNKGVQSMLSMAQDAPYGGRQKTYGGVNLSL